MKKITADEVLSQPDGYDKFVRAMFNRSGDPAKDFAHAILGVVTEIHEMRNFEGEVNFLEEAGDLKFYTHALRQVCEDHEGYEFTEQALLLGLGLVPDSFFVETAEQSPVLINELLDVAKRWVGYGKLSHSLTGVCCAVVNLAAVEILAIAPHLEDDDGFADRCERANVEKLLDRYNGMQFDAERAVNRDLDSERRVLESAAAS